MRESRKRPRPQQGQYTNTPSITNDTIRSRTCCGGKLLYGVMGIRISKLSSRTLCHSFLPISHRPRYSRKVSRTCRVGPLPVTFMLEHRIMNAMVRCEKSRQDDARG